MRLRKSFTIMKGVRINFSKSGISTTFGPRGLSVNVGKKGTYFNTGIPGTGLYNRHKIVGSSRNSQNSNVSISNNPSQIIFSVGIDSNGTISIKD